MAHSIMGPCRSSSHQAGLLTALEVSFNSKAEPGNELADQRIRPASELATFVVCLVIALYSLLSIFSFVRVLFSRLHDGEVSLFRLSIKSHRIRSY